MQAESPRRAAPLVLSLVPALAGLTASVMLAVDYLRPAPVFCAEDGGCAALKQTALASILGVPTPLFGVAGFLLLSGVALLPGRRARLVQVVLACVAAVAGAVFLSAQWAFGHFCPYCFVADTSAILSALAALWRGFGTSDPRPSRALVAAGSGAVVLAGLVPAVVGLGLPERAAPAPEVIRDEMARTPRGKVTVVDFVDFECPYCRMTHASLEPLLEAHSNEVRVVRRQVPLPMHVHAHDAARAACCGEELGKGEAMANALFSAPVEELTPDGCEKLAQSVGLSLDPYRACIADPRTDKRIDDDRANFKAAGGYALPTIWIGGQQLVGAQPAEALEKVIADATRSRLGS